MKRRLVAATGEEAGGGVPSSSSTTAVSSVVAETSLSNVVGHVNDDDHNGDDDVAWVTLLGSTSSSASSSRSQSSSFSGSFKSRPEKRPTTTNNSRNSGSSINSHNNNSSSSYGGSDTSLLQDDDDDDGVNSVDDYHSVDGGGGSGSDGSLSELPTLMMSPASSVLRSRNNTSLLYSPINNNSNNKSLLRMMKGGSSSSSKLFHGSGFDHLRLSSSSLLLVDNNIGNDGSVADMKFVVEDDEEENLNDDYGYDEEDVGGDQKSKKEKNMVQKKKKLKKQMKKKKKSDQHNSRSMIHHDNSFNHYSFNNMSFSGGGGRAGNGMLLPTFASSCDISSTASLSSASKSNNNNMRRSHRHHHQPPSSSSAKSLRAVFYLQMIGVLIVAGLLTSLVLMIQLETNYDANGVVTSTSTSSTSSTSLQGSVVSQSSSNQKKTTMKNNETTPTRTSKTTMTPSKDQHHDDNSSNFQSSTKNNTVEKLSSSSSSSAAIATVATPIKTETDTSHGHQTTKHEEMDEMTERLPYQRRPQRQAVSFDPLPDHLEYLGVLIDAGRYYFPIPWLYELLDHLHVMGYNYIHFRLTDDQVWAVQNITSSSSFNRNSWNQSVVLNNDSDHNNDDFAYNARGEPTYTLDELRQFVQVAKYQYNMTIIPEINVPGHAASWGMTSSYPTLVVSCPLHACRTGYGVPLNVTHPLLPNLLKDILTTFIVDVFDRPPFIHLGGDELQMSEPCLKEAGISNFTRWLYNDVEYFEGTILKTILINDLNYTEDQIIRWETTLGKNKDDQTAGKKNPFEPLNPLTGKPFLDRPIYRRLGSIVQYWHSEPSSYRKPAPSGFDDKDGPTTTTIDSKNGHQTHPERYMTSTGMYLDVLQTRGNQYGYGDYTRAQTITYTLKSPSEFSNRLQEQLESDPDLFISSSAPPSLPFAVIAGTFELSVDFWRDRNVLGRLLAIRMGVGAPSPSAQHMSPHDIANNTAVEIQPMSKNSFDTAYDKKCKEVFPDDDVLCKKQGWPLVEDKTYQTRWKRVWGEFKKGVCDGMTMEAVKPSITPSDPDPVIQREANQNYWDKILYGLTGGPEISDSADFDKRGTESELYFAGLQNVTTSVSIPNAGVYIDLVQFPYRMDVLERLLDALKQLKLNTVHLALTTDSGNAIDRGPSGLGYLPPMQSQGTFPRQRGPYHLHDLKRLAHYATLSNIHVIPEISLVTNAGGWINSGMLANCPETLCQNENGAALDVISNLEGVLPLTLSTIQDVYSIFHTPMIDNDAPLLHLGFDERNASLECFREAGHSSNESIGSIDRYEFTLSNAIKILGIDEDRILRWHNSEDNIFANQVGGVSHYSGVQLPTKHINAPDADNSSFFATVEINDEMSPYDVYTSTRHIADYHPTGIIAKSPAGVPRFSQLVGFVLAISTNLVFDEPTFREEMQTICGSLNCGVIDLEFPSTTAYNASNAEIDHSRSCLERTTKHRIRTSKATGHIVRF